MSSLETQLPSDWDFGPIEPHIDFLTGPAFDSKRFTDDDNGIRLARGINITTGTMRWGKSITQYWPKLTSDVARYQLAENDILIGMDGSKVGKNYAYLQTEDVPSLLVQRVARLRTDEELVPRFLYYFIASDFWISHVESVKTASAIPHISNGDIKHFEIAKPNPPEQRKIARILTTLDNLIEKTEALIAKYQSIKQGMMHDLFTRGVDESGRLRPTHEQAPDLYKQSELGWIPKEWEAVTLGDELKQIEQGWSPDCDSIPPKVGQWGVLKTTAVLWEGYNDQGSKVLPPHLEPRPEYEVKVGDILMTRGGPNSRVGVVSYVYNTQAQLMLSDKLYRIIPNDSFVPEYLSLALSSDATQIYLSSLKTGLAESQTNISQAIVRRLKVLRPQPTEQTEIARQIRSTAQIIQRENRLLQKRLHNKQGLMQDLLTGKVRVKVG